MTTPETRNAEIESTFLGFEDHGILTCYLHLRYDGGGQGFGGFCLDNFSEVDSRRVGSAFGAEFIRQVLLTVGVERWEDLPGQRIRVEAESSKVHRIGHFLKENWFDPAELAQQMGLKD